MKIVRNKVIWHLTVPLCCLLIGIGLGHLPTRSDSVESALRTVRIGCERELWNNGDFRSWK